MAAPSTTTVVLELVKALADGKTDNATRHQAETQFTALREAHPVQALQALLQLLDQTVGGAGHDASPSSLAFTTSLLILLKNTVPKVWGQLPSDSDRTALFDKLLHLFLGKGLICSDLKTRARVGHVLETILVSKECDGEAREALRKDFLPQLCRALDQDLDSHLPAVLQLVVDGLQSATFFEQVCGPHQAKVEQLLLSDAAAKFPNGPELRALLFLRICEFTPSEKIPRSLCVSFVPKGVLQVLVDSKNEEKKKEILQAIMEAAAKNIFSDGTSSSATTSSSKKKNQKHQNNQTSENSGLLPAAVQAIHKAAQDFPDSLTSLAVQAILAIIEAEEVDSLLHGPNAKVLEDVFDLCFQMCVTSIDEDEYEKWLSQSNAEDDTEEDVAVALEAIDRLMRKTQPGGSGNNNEEGEQDEEDGEEPPLLLPTFFEKLRTQLDEKKWTHEVAKLLMLQYVLQYVQDPEQLEEIKKLGFHSVNNSQNARARFAAWCLLGEFSTSKREFSVKTEETKHQWLEILTKAIKSEQSDSITSSSISGETSSNTTGGNSRVLSKALDTFLYYAGDDARLDVEDVEPFADELLKSFVTIVDRASGAFLVCGQNQKSTSDAGQMTPSTDSGQSTNGSEGQSPTGVLQTHHNQNQKSYEGTAHLSETSRSLLSLQVSAISAITAVVEVLQTRSEKYYKDLMPILFAVLEKNSNSGDTREILGSAIECASTLGQYVTSIETTMSNNNNRAICEAMVRVLQTATMADDPVKDYAFESANKLVSVMKHAFVEFLPGFLPEVYLRLKKNGFDASNKEQLEANLDTGDIGSHNMEVSMVMRLDPHTGQQKLLCIKSAYIEDLHNALNVLKKFVEHLGRMFIPFVEECVAEVEPLLDFQFDDEVRASAYDVYAEVVQLCCVEGNISAVRKLVTKFVDNVLKAWAEARNASHGMMDPTRTKTQADGLEGILKAAGGNVLAVAEVDAVAKACMEELKSTLAREGKAEDEEDAEIEGELQVSLVGAIGALMRHHRPEFVQGQAFPTYSAYLKEAITSSDPEILRVGKLIAADFAEHLPRETIILYPVILPPLKSSVSVKKVPEEVQAGAFALSMLVKEPEFAESKESLRELKNIGDRCCEYIQKVRTWKKASTPRGMQFACDNCLACLGNVLHYHGEKLEDAPSASKSYVSGLWQGFATCLPLREDEEEAMRVHELLVDLVLEQHPEIVKNLAEAVRIMTVIYKTPMANEGINEKIGRVVGGVSGELLEKTVAGFPAKMKAKVKRIYEDIKNVGGANS